MGRGRPKTWTGNVRRTARSDALRSSRTRTSLRREPEVEDLHARPRIRTQHQAAIVAWARCDRADQVGAVELKMAQRLMTGAVGHQLDVAAAPRILRVWGPADPHPDPVSLVGGSERTCSSSRPHPVRDCGLHRTAREIAPSGAIRVVPPQCEAVMKMCGEIIAPLHPPPLRFPHAKLFRRRTTRSGLA